MLWTLTLTPLLAAALVLAWRPRTGLLVALTGLAMFTTLVLASLVIASGWRGSLQWSELLQLQLSLTPAAGILALLLPIIALPVLWYVIVHAAGPGLHRLVCLLLVFVGAMLLLVSAADFLTLLIGWEVVGACSWALIAHRWRDGRGPDSGLYAFITTRVGDLGLFLAAMVVYQATGQFTFDALATLDGLPLQLATAGIVLSACAKSGQLPFSPWLFRAMAGPVPVSALLHAATMVAAGAYLLIRLQPELSRVAWFSTSLLVVGLTTALAGGVVALLQGHAKKLLAASTSAHFGLMLVAVGAGYPLVALLHLVAHAFFKAVLFLAAGIAGEKAGSHLFADMGGGRFLLIPAIASAVGASALAGLPPLGAGWTKEMITTAAGHSYPALALLVIACGGLSAAYGARFHWLAFGGGSNDREGRPPLEKVALATLVVGTMVLSLLWITPLSQALGRLLGGSFPEPKPWELPVSLFVVALGLYGGYRLAASGKQALMRGSFSRCAEWFGLPAVIETALIRPVVAIARYAARLDERWVDALPRAPVAASGWMSRVSGRSDQSLVDRGIVATAALGDALSRLSRQWGEALTDGVPEITAKLAGSSGQDSRVLQSGLSHHYFAVLVIGCVLLFSLVWFGSN